MPNLGLHVGFALDCASRLGHPITDEFRGAYLLGCTTPDIRLALGWERDRTHFFDLETGALGSSVPRLLDTHPHLKHQERLSRETVAFLLGYMSHLETDETWIVQMWRRYFGEGSPMGADPLVYVYDRAFQYELDRVERQNITDLEGAVESIRGAYTDVDIGFIDKETLQRWQGSMVNRIGRELPWERFRSFINRVHRAAPESEVEAIMARLPEILAHVQEHISQAEVQAFREQAVRSFVARARAYLKDEVRA